MRRTRFDRWPCPIARAADLIGDWWTPLLLRNAFAGQRRFEEFQQSLGMSRGVLTQRLQRLVDEGIFVKHRYQEHPPRYEYRLTEKGREFWGVLAAMWRWGEDWLWEDGKAPVQLVDRDTGAEIRPLVIDENSGEPLDVRRIGIKGRIRSKSPLPLKGEG